MLKMTASQQDLSDTNPILIVRFSEFSLLSDVSELSLFLSMKDLTTNKKALLNEQGYFISTLKWDSSARANISWRDTSIGFLGNLFSRSLDTKKPQLHI